MVQSPCRGKTYEECEQIRINQIRSELKIVEANLAHIPHTKIDSKYRKEIKKYISAIRWYISHKRSWPAKFQDSERPTVCEIWTMFQKNVPIVLCAEALARSAPMDAEQRQAKERLLYNLRRPTTWAPPPEKITGSDIKGDPNNKHPANIRYLEEQKKRKLLDRRNELNALKPKRTPEEIEKEVKERRKRTLKQRKERKKHFERLEKERSGKGELTLGV